MSTEVIVAVVDAIAEAEVHLPGINGEAATAACFAGQWIERCGAAAPPFQGQRIYEAISIEAVGNRDGCQRLPAAGNRALLTGQRAFILRLESREMALIASSNAD